MAKGDNKANYFEKLRTLFDTYQSIFIVNVDNVGSQQMHEIRRSLRGKAEVVMGKNTMIRRAIKDMSDDFPTLEKLLPHLRGNVGFVFTNDTLADTRDLIVSNRVRAPARAGAIAPVDVWVPAGNTGMEPGKTSFFQALGVPTKIARGTIEIINDMHLIKVGNKVGASEATLLNMLNISPFTYGMTITQVFDEGTTFAPSVLDISADDLLEQITEGIARIAALSLQINFLSTPAVPHLLINHYKDLLAVSVETEYTFAGSEQIKAYLADPSAFAVAAAPAASAAAAGGDSGAAAAAEEEAEESDDDMGFGLFD
ncbi:ribosomal protein P0 (A0) (L10E) [Dimargaris xerosporica]|nr:ribosomal protein P0 (A0) (L10E) [Dimargaris xerosporica]